MNIIYRFLFQPIIYFFISLLTLIGTGYFLNLNFFHKNKDSFASSKNFSEPFITLTGKLRLKLFPGPPEYSSIAEGDRSDYCWVVELDDPSFNLALNLPENEIFLELSDILERSNARDLTLCLNEKQINLCQKSKDHYVAVRGNLFHSHTSHHYTPFLMSLYEIVKSDNWYYHD